MKLKIAIKKHSYGGVLALVDIDIEVESGEIVCIIGPSGCGKSTLLSIVGGLLRPTDGYVRTIGDVPAGCITPLTYIFQDFSLLPWRTVFKNVSLPLEDRGLDGLTIEKQVSSALSRTGLSDYARFYPKQLSGGMRQRVGIARALAVQPNVLLMDEPFSALDAQTRELLLADFLAIWARDRLTAVYVTHNLDEAIKVADRIVVLSRRPGRIKEVIAIDIPQHERHEARARAVLDDVEDRLWALIKDEALLAANEVTHV